MIDPRPALALGLASPARGWGRGRVDRPVGRRRPGARPRSLGFGEYRSTVARCRREYRVGMPSISSSEVLLLLLGGLLLVVLLDVLALRVGLLRLGLVVVVADVLLPLRGEPGDGLGGSGRSAHEVVVLVGAAIVVLVLVGVAQAVGGPSRLPLRLVGAATSSSESSSAFSTFSLSSPGSAPAPRAVLRPLPPPRRSSALVVGGVPVDVRREAHRRGLSRRASRPGAHRVSMCIPDRTRTIPRRRCSESCAGPRARVRSWTFLNKLSSSVVMGNSNGEDAFGWIDEFPSQLAVGNVCVRLWLSRPSDEHIQTVRFVSGK